MREIVRIEKIEVNVVENSKEHKLVMNKNLSTPLNCAMRKSSLFIDKNKTINLKLFHKKIYLNCSLSVQYWLWLTINRGI